MRSEMSGISSIVCPRNFSQRTHSPHKVILFEEPLMSTFRKHIVFPPTDVSGWSCGGEKMLIFEKVWSWIPPDPRRDLRDPRKKRPFLRTKFVFPLHTLKPLQIWAETAQWARRTMLSKWAHKNVKISKNILCFDFSTSRGDSTVFISNHHWMQCSVVKMPSHLSYT